MKRVFALIMAILLVGALFTACGGESGRKGSDDSDNTIDSRLIGIWKSNGNSYTITFEEDNTGKIYYENGLWEGFDYQIKGDSLTMVYYEDTTKKFSYEVSEDTLTIMSEDGKRGEDFTKTNEISTGNGGLGLDADSSSGLYIEQTSIYGSWVTEKDGVRIIVTFEKNGCGKWCFEDSGLTYDMEWDTQEDTITMNLYENGEKCEYIEGTYEIEEGSATTEDKLIITNDSGTMEFTSNSQNNKWDSSIQLN